MVAVNPSSDEYASLTRDYDVVALHSEVRAGGASPLALFDALGADGAVLIEAVDPASNAVTRSTLFLDPWATLVATAGRVEWSGAAVPHVDEGGAFPALRSALSAVTVAPQSELFAGCGVAAGYIGYDAVRELVDIGPPQPGGPQLPDVAIGWHRIVVVFDHMNDNVGVLVRGVRFDGGATYDELARSVEATVAAVVAARHPVGEEGRGFVGPDDPTLESDIGRPAYESMIRAALDAVDSGVVEQLGPSQRFVVRYPADRPFDVYRSLRQLNRAPHMFYVRVGDAAVAGASPRALLKVEGRTVVVSPIAGTRRRGPAAESELAHELLSDDKERRELSMLVDLAVAELAAVTDDGSVSVEDEPSIVALPGLLHMSATVWGALATDKTGVDALAAVFPSGTVVGTPKIDAMRLLTRIEPERRGVYGGCVGWFGPGDDLETYLAIRTAVLRDGEASVQTGAGVVRGSDVGREVQESENKARGVVRAIKAVSG